MTDFDYGSVYGAERGNAGVGLLAAIRRIIGFDAHAKVASVRHVAPTGKADRGYLADIGMEVGF